MPDYTKEQVIQKVKLDIQRYEKQVKNSFSDLGYWSAVSQLEFARAELKYLTDETKG